MLPISYYLKYDIAILKLRWHSFLGDFLMDHTHWPYCASNSYTMAVKDFAEINTQSPRAVHFSTFK